MKAVFSHKNFSKSSKWFSPFIGSDNVLPNIFIS